LGVESGVVLGRWGKVRGRNRNEEWEIRSKEERERRKRDGKR
jgi:hypothetical protein